MYCLQLQFVFELFVLIQIILTSSVTWLSLKEQKSVLKQFGIVFF